MTIFQTTLAKNPNFYEQTIDLIEKSFNYTNEHRFEDDFYPLMEPSNHENNHILIKDNKVVAHIGVNFKIFKKGNTRTKIALIGGVAVSQSHRGQGHFNKLFNFVIERYGSDSSLFLLWSEKSQMYKKYNFVEFGTIFQSGNTTSDPLFFNSQGFYKEQLSSLPHKEILKLDDLYQDSYKNYISPVRTQRDWENYSNICSTDLYIKRCTSKQIEDYFFINKGFDLPHIIHECSFINNDTLIDSFSSYMLWSPKDYNKSSINTYQKLFTGLIKVANPILFTDFIQSIFDQDIQIDKVEDTSISFTFKEMNYSMSPLDFIVSIFGPNPAQDFEDYKNTFFVPGLDSI